MKSRGTCEIPILPLMSELPPLRFEGLNFKIGKSTFKQSCRASQNLQLSFRAQGQVVFKNFEFLAGQSFGQQGQLGF